MFASWPTHISLKFIRDRKSRGFAKGGEVIVTNALQYLDSLSTEVGDDIELQSELATAYEKIGDVQGAMNNSSLGNIQAGLDSYDKARKLPSLFLTLTHRTRRRKKN